MVVETLQEEDELYLVNSAIGSIALIFELILKPEAGYVDEDPSAERHLEMLVNSGVRQAFAQRGTSVENVDVDITVDRGPTFGEFEDHDLEDVPRPVLEQMLLADEITSDEFVTAVARMVEEEKENSDE
jgi:DNA-binding transcriptional MocR family regulator